MVLTLSFKEMVQARASRDPAFRQALLQEAVQVLLDGDVASGRSVLRDYINATIGFDALAEATHTPAKSLMRMFGPKGNPTAANLFAVIQALQDRTGVRLEVRVGGWLMGGTVLTREKLFWLPRLRRFEPINISIIQSALIRRRHP